MDLLAIPLLALFVVIVVALSSAPSREHYPGVHIAGEDDQEIDFDAALRSLDRDPR